MRQPTPLARMPLCAIFLIHSLGIGLLLLAAIAAKLRDLPFETFALSPLSLVERALLEIQAHPEEGIHVLARVQVPPYAGVLHLGKLILWTCAATLVFRAPRSRIERAALLLFPLAMICEASFLALEHVQPVEVVFAVYLAALACTLGMARHDAGRPVCLVIALLWLGVRMGADSLLGEGMPLLALETLSGLLAPALWALYLVSLSGDDRDGAKE